jgi:hypothetical protein
MNISTKEILSGDPILREMGYRGLIGLFTTQGAKGIAIMKLYGAITGLGQDIMKEYQQNLAPGYQKNSQLLAITKAVKGKFKMVDLSTVLPYDYVRRPWEALNNALNKKELNDENFDDFMLNLMFDEAGPVREFFDPFISTPIGLEAFLDIKRGYTKNGKKIWSELDDISTKTDKSFEYFYRQLEPGAVTTLRQMYSAYTGVPYKGRVYDQQDVLMGLATGIKPYDVDVNKTVDFLIGDYTKIRSKAFQGSQLYKTETNNENGEIRQEFIDIQRNIWREQRRIWKAFQTAKKFGVSTSTLRKELRSRNVSYSDVRKILSAKFDPLPYSKARFKGKLEELKELNREWNKTHPNNKRSINKRSFYPKRELDKVLRFLKNQKLDEEFKYDKITVPTIEMNNQSSLMMPDKKTASLPANTNIQTPPLGNTPMPAKMATNTLQKDPQTNLTRTETALLSPTEKVIAGRT